MTSDLKEFQFSDADQREVEDYRGVSKCAIAAVFLALASPLALIHWSLSLVPIASIVFSLFAIRFVSRNESLIGRKAAVMAMVVSCFLLAFSNSRFISREQTIKHQAEAFAERWLRLVMAGSGDVRKLHAAFELHKPAQFRSVKGTDLMERLGTLDAPPEGSPQDAVQATRFREFFDSEPLKTIIRFGATAKLTSDGTKKMAQVNNDDVVYPQFTVSYVEQGEKKKAVIVIELHRQLDKDKGEADWRVEEVATPKILNL